MIKAMAFIEEEGTSDSNKVKKLFFYLIIESWQKTNLFGLGNRES